MPSNCGQPVNTSETIRGGANRLGKLEMLKPFYETEKAALYKGDALEILPELPAGSIDICLTDLPYGVTMAKWDKKLDMDAMWSAVRYVMKPDSAILLFSYGLFLAELMLSQRSAYKFKYIWEKTRSTNPQHAQYQPLRNFEEIAVFSFGKLPYFPQKTYGHKPSNASTTRPRSSNIFRRSTTSIYPGGDTSRYPQAIIKFPGLATACPERKHPTQKPVGLLQYLIRQHSNPGDTVLDFTCGSGSTGVGALLEKRKFIGIDRERRFITDAADWISQVEGNPLERELIINAGSAPLFEQSGEEGAT
jgi:site-specific DNA-methyltransferase (adenine-specific)